MSYLLQALFVCPKCWRVLGYWIFVFSVSMLLMGWRLTRKLERIESKTAVVVDFDKVLGAIPLPVPTTGAGFALAIAGALFGILLAMSARWAQRFS